MVGFSLTIIFDVSLAAYSLQWFVSSRTIFIWLIRFVETRTGALELEKPGRDPRSPIEEFRFADGVSTMEDLKPGMKIPAIITNVTNLEHLQMWE